MILRLLIFIFSFIFSDYFGGYAGSNFRYSSNARDMSLGGTLISEYNNGFNSFSNPALLSQVKKLEIGVSYFPMSLDRHIQTFSISRSLSSNGGASLSIFNSGVSSVEGKDFYNNPTGEFDSSEGYVMLSFGVGLGKSSIVYSVKEDFNHDTSSQKKLDISSQKFSSSKLNIGFNVKVAFNNIDKYSATGVAMDLGMLYNISDKSVFSVVLNNIFGQYSWDGLSPGDPIYIEDLPSLNSLGFKHDISSFFKKQFFSDVALFTRVDHMNVNNLSLSRLRLGAELGYSDYEFRLGFVQHQGLENIDVRFLLGFGFISKKYKFDYCIDFGKENEGISNLFSISF